MLGQLVDDINGSLELRLLFLGHFLTSEPPSASLGPAVHPLQVVALPEDGGVEAVDIRGIRWEWREILEDPFELIDKLGSGGMFDIKLLRLWGLEVGCSIGANSGLHKEFTRIARFASQGVDGRGSGWGKSTGDSVLEHN